MKATLFLLLIIWALADRGEASWKKTRWELEENDTVKKFEAHPVKLQAEKLASLTADQTTVSTCRYILFKEPLPFVEAEQKCENLEWPIKHKGSAELATVQNEDENNDIKTLIRTGFGFHTKKKDNSKEDHFHWENWAWIGLKKHEDNARRLDEDTEQGKFNGSQWSYPDGQLANYSNFVRPNPDQDSQGKAKKNNLEYQIWVAVNKAGLWDDKFGSTSYPFICQYCGKYVVMSLHVRWDKAQEECESAGLEFATVNNQDENDELWYAANATLGKDILKPRFNDTNWLWIGEKKNNKTGDWEHYDGSSFDSGFEPDWDFKHQPDGATDKKLGTESVVAMSRINGRWDDSFIPKTRPFACMCPRDTCKEEN